MLVTQQGTRGLPSWVLLGSLLFVIFRNDPFSMSLLDHHGHWIGLKDATVSSLLGRQQNDLALHHVCGSFFQIANKCAETKAEYSSSMALVTISFGAKTATMRNRLPNSVTTIFTAVS